MTFNLNTSAKSNKFNHNSKKTTFKKTAIASAIALSLSFSTTAAEFNVTEATDDGTGLVANSLSWAMLQANTTPGDDVITLNTDVTIIGVMKRLIDSNTTLHSDSTRRTIDGDNNFRPLFIKSGNVIIENVDMVNGMAQGGGLGLGGDGANMGGSIFIYDGNITIKSVRISNSSATTNAPYNNGRGGGGIFGSSYGSGGGGMFASTSSDLGGYGGYGNYRTNDSKFGEGGSSNSGNSNLAGRFGGGGAFISSNHAGKGGFGGGGGRGFNGSGGDGGFGAGGGSSNINLAGMAGYGGNNEFAASMGGAIFVRSGDLNLSNMDIHSSHAITANGASGALGLGGALFIMHSTANSNGNNQGMPIILPSVTGCGISFNGNSASDDTNTSNNNDDIFDLSNNFNNITSCESEIKVTGNNQIINDGDTIPDIADNTDFGVLFINTVTNVKTFTISNIGGMDLNLTGKPLVAINGINASEFLVTSQPIVSTITGLSSTTFEVTFTPTTVGFKTAIVTIENNDADENSYDFVIQGVGQGPEISVSGNSTIIEDGDNTPELTDFTDFGFNQQTHVFTIENLGVADLTLSSAPNIQLTGIDVADFSVTMQPTNNIISSQSSIDFQIEFNPSNIGQKTVIVNIENDDADEGMYSFTIHGGELQEPEIEIESNGTILLDESNFSPDLWNSVPVTGSPLNNIAFTIKNSGPVFLQLFEFSIFGADASDFIFTPPNVSQIQPNSSSDFLINFNPSSSGFRNATIRIFSTDSDESFYDINLMGRGIPTVSLMPGNPVDIQEGGALNFTAGLDSAAISNIIVNYNISGDVEAADFDSNSLTGQVTINTGEFGADINLTTIMDGITEGPELVVLGIQSSSPDVFMGDSLAIGQVDDTLIFENGFEPIMPALFAEIFTSTNTENQKLIYDGINHSFVYFDSEYRLDVDFNGFDYTPVYQWLENTLIQNKPDADWDEDSIVNQYDDEPFGS